MVSAGQYYKVGRLYRDVINDRPTFKISFQEVFTSGKGEKFTINKKLRSKTFIKSPKYLDIIKQDAYIIELKSVAKNYKPKLQVIKSQKEEATKNYQMFDFNFSYVIDLHAESLGLDTHAKNIRSEQLNRFEEWLNKAIIVGHSPLFVVHGVGKGVLRDAIHNRLTSNRSVSQFFNEFHPQYGYGSTEIILK